MYRILSFLAIFIIFGISTTSAHETKDDSVTVHVDQNGYYPTEITIKPGTEVIFENSGDFDHWPATDNHPTHTHYDGTSLDAHCSSDTDESFDACKAISPTESWSFVFNKEGSFPYHDHLWPQLQGTVIVSSNEPLSVFQKIITVAKKVNTIFLQSLFPGLLPIPAELEEPNVPQTPPERYTALVVNTDPAWAIEALKEESELDPVIQATCHEILHEIGQTAFYQYGSFEAASVYQSNFCNSGYIHGVFEEYFRTVSDPSVDLAAMCSIYAHGEAAAFKAWQCEHGVGHGFMYLTGGNLDESLQLCSDAFQDEKSADHCHNGAYMEIFNEEILAKEADYFESRDPMQICNDRSIARSQCYHYLPVYFAQDESTSYLDMFPICEAAPSGYGDSCKLGISSEAMKRSMHQPEVVFSMCADIQALRDQTICLAGAASMYVNQTGSIEAATEMCDSLEDAFSVACNEVVNLRKPEFK